jgi:hypothetical protein
MQAETVSSIPLAYPQAHPLFQPRNFRPGGLFKFVEMFGLFTTCFFKLFHILVELKCKTFANFQKHIIKIYCHCPSKKKKSHVTSAEDLRNVSGNFGNIRDFLLVRCYISVRRITAHQRTAAASTGT